MNVDSAAILAFLFFAVSVSLTPGPNNVLMASYGATVGYVRSIPPIIGVSSGFLGLLVIASAGGAALVTNHHRVGVALHIVGAAYLLYLAWQLATAPSSAITVGGVTSEGDDERKASIESPGRGGFWRMLLLQFANPKAWIMALSTMTTYRTSFPPGWSGFVLLCTLFTLVNLASNSVWALFGQGVGTLLDRPRKVKFFNLVMALLLTVSVVATLI